MSISKNLELLKGHIPAEATLVAVSKTKPVDYITEAYEAGHRHFGENKIQEMTEKWETLPKDIQWHMIGHVQRNKVKYMAPYVSLIHTVDSLKLLKEIEKEAAKNERSIKCLLQIKIAEEDTKYGTTVAGAKEILNAQSYKEMAHVEIVGLMGMATLTEDQEKVRKEFNFLRTTFDELKQLFPGFTTLSMGMSGDYQVALDCGSNMIRVGSAIFGERNYK